MGTTHKVSNFNAQCQGQDTCVGFYLTHPVPDKDNAKRVRLSEAAVGEPNGIHNHIGRVGRASSIGENATEPPARHQRIGSIVSNGESYYAPSVMSASQRTPGEESTTASPSAGYFDRRREHSPSFAVSPRDSSAQPPTFPLRRDPAYLEGPRNEAPPPPRHLPSLSDMFDGRPMPNGVAHPGEGSGPTFGILPRGHQTNSPAHTPSISGSDSRPPSLRKEQSSAGSMSSGSSYNSSYPRTPVEGPLPIHALLTGGKQFGPHETTFAASPAIYRSMSPDDRGLPVHYQPERAPSDPTSAGHPMPHHNGELGLPTLSFRPARDQHAAGYYPGHASRPNHTPPAPARPAYQAGYNENRLSLPPVPATASGPVPGRAPARPSGKSDTGLDGISALLQADKIVDRRSG